MKQALNATFFGLDLGIENDTLMTILLIAEVVVCVLLLVLMIYILCSKKLADVVRETVRSEQSTHVTDSVRETEVKKTEPAVLPVPAGNPRAGAYANRNAQSGRTVLPPIVLPTIWINK